ncbi:hypothetical protein COU74_00160 [Candidatus Peregrinibacteria bacterium CG10_big_fil_rev_8_21_14_0_10_36_19]|nr:MAG: hypothetical protein COU74_00160 [Candidatus Peregrinibacteria bacterium CG10_big_fil_rev_8_21_14_0_10_36_19]
MDIIWHGKTCFTVKGKKNTVVINPVEEAGKLKGEIVLSSTKNIANVDGAKKVIDWPGEFEVSEVPVVGFQAWTASKDSEQAEETLIYFFKVDDVKFCHLGELGHTLTSEMVSKIGDVDVLMIKAGPSANLDAKKGLEVVEAIEPRAVIPMGEVEKDNFLKELGESELEPKDKFTLNSQADLPTEKRIHVLLKKI